MLLVMGVTTCCTTPCDATDAGDGGDATDGTYASTGTDGTDGSDSTDGTLYAVGVLSTDAGLL